MAEKNTPGGVPGGESGDQSGAEFTARLDEIDGRLDEIDSRIDDEVAALRRVLAQRLAEISELDEAIGSLRGSFGRLYERVGALEGMPDDWDDRYAAGWTLDADSPSGWRPPSARR